MNTVVLRPSFRYLIKLTFGALLASLLFFILGFMLKGSFIPMGMLGGIYLLASPAITTAYWRSLRYEITTEEIIVHSGLLTKTVRHVPFRTVTNIEVTRDLFDRILGVGLLSIQTAGYSGIKAPEERLVGLSNVGETYEYVANELRRFRGAMSPTQAGSEGYRSPTDAQLLQAILNELHAIRVELQRR